LAFFLREISVRKLVVSENPVMARRGWRFAQARQLSRLGSTCRASVTCGCPPD
jgi:hypothetical protein